MQLRFRIPDRELSIPKIFLSKTIFANLDQDSIKPDYDHQQQHEYGCMEMSVNGNINMIWI